jgi:SHS2 domain-containing protein
MVSLEKRFEPLEHTADLYFAAYGKNLKEAFENAAYATFESMTNLDKVQPQLVELAEVKGHDEKALLYNWLELLLIKFDTTGNLYSRFKIISLTQKPKGFNLKAKIWGEQFNPQKHTSKVGIKAITYHKMEIVKEPESVTLKFILDV